MWGPKHDILCVRWGGEGYSMSPLDRNNNSLSESSPSSTKRSNSHKYLNLATPHTKINTDTSEPAAQFTVTSFSLWSIISTHFGCCQVHRHNSMMHKTYVIMMR